jgi:hypothetical protein
MKTYFNQGEAIYFLRANRYESRSVALRYLLVTSSRLTDIEYGKRPLHRADVHQLCDIMGVPLIYFELLTTECGDANDVRDKIIKMMSTQFQLPLPPWIEPVGSASYDKRTLRKAR